MTVPERPLLSVADLRVTFSVDGAELRAVDGVSFELAAGRTLALVGESGCGKSATALALLGLVQPPGRISGGSVRYREQELVGSPEAALGALRGNRIAMVFQEPMTALNPVVSVGEQVAEPLRVHRRAPRSEARRRAVELLGEVGIAGAAERYNAYPHELSGGMRQRVMIAMALACEPEVMIADEPTTALDVTIQAQILALLRRLQGQRRVAMLFITHDLGLLPLVADDVAVMYAGRIVERADVTHLLAAPRHPYSRALLDSMPRGARRGERLRAIPGVVPDLRLLPAGCAFYERCGRPLERCATEPPPMQGGVACFHPHPEPR